MLIRSICTDCGPARLWQSRSMPGEKACSEEPLQYLSGFGEAQVLTLRVCYRINGMHV